MANTPEELAVELSRAALAWQDDIENQLREKASAILSAASIVVPVAAVAFNHAPPGTAIPCGVAAVAYFWCARSCGASLFPRAERTGLLGGEMLDVVAGRHAELRQMQASAASYLDDFYRHNQIIIEAATARVREAIVALGVEILALVVALIAKLVH